MHCCTRSTRVFGASRRLLQGRLCYNAGEASGTLRRSLVGDRRSGGSPLCAGKGAPITPDNAARRRVYGGPVSLPGSTWITTRPIPGT